MLAGVAVPCRRTLLRVVTARRAREALSVAQAEGTQAQTAGLPGFVLDKTVHMGI
jgi:hypothetical protein